MEAYTILNFPHYLKMPKVPEMPPTEHISPNKIHVEQNFRFGQISLFGPQTSMDIKELKFTKLSKNTFSNLFLFLFTNVRSNVHT